MNQTQPPTGVDSQIWSTVPFFTFKKNIFTILSMFVQLMYATFTPWHIYKQAGRAHEKKVQKGLHRNIRKHINDLINLKKLNLKNSKFNLSKLNFFMLNKF